MKCDICGSTATDHTEQQCSLNRIFNKSIQYETIVVDNTVRKQDAGCLHENCSGCKNGTCSGVHMLSCPCRKCRPVCL